MTRLEPARPAPVQPVGEGSERAPRVWVAGWCQRPMCGRPYLEEHPWTPAAIAAEWPMYCSRECKRAAGKIRQRAQKAQARCWACWRRPRQHGWLCRPCWRDAERAARAMCEGKQRLGRETALDRAESWITLHGKSMSAYGCSVCGWWHVGHKPADPAAMKRRSLTVDLLVASLSEVELAELRARWEPV